jgi:hypothetical protein
MKSAKKYFLLFFSLVLLFPSAISLSHVFAHEEHEVCDNFSNYHFHEKSLDCDLCHLQSGSFLVYIPGNCNFYFPPTPNKLFFDHYQFLSDFKKLSFELRGPPVLQVG